MWSPKGLNLQLVEFDVAFEDDLRWAGTFEIDGPAFHQLDRLLSQEAGDDEFFDVGWRGTMEENIIADRCRWRPYIHAAGGLLALRRRAILRRSAPSCREPRSVDAPFLGRFATHLLAVVLLPASAAPVHAGAAPVIHVHAIVPTLRLPVLGFR